MHRITSLCIAAILICSCNDPETRTANEDQNAGSDKSVDSVSAAPASLSGCYIRVLKRDTLVAHLQQEGENFTGRLTFDNYQKDGSTGTVKGRIENGVIKLLYSFSSEGMNSVMEVYFKQADSALIPATGKLKNHGDTVFFADPSDLNYAEKDKLVPIDCGHLADKYR